MCKVFKHTTEREKNAAMKFNNVELEKECERILRDNPDIDGYRHPFVNVSDTIKAYFALADYFTDPSSDATESMLIGIRSMPLLCSALSRQTISFGSHTKYNNPIDICSTLFFGMVKNHSFSDGNKRTALLILLYQLDMYNYMPIAPIKDFEKLVVAVAANQLPVTYASIWKKYNKADDASIKTIAYILRKSTQKKDHSYHLKITVKDLVAALEKHGVTTSNSAGKMHFERVIPAKWFKKKENLQYAINFGGWTRCLGASTVRNILSALKLYEEIPDYQSLIDGNQLFYSLIEDFEGPLRRLKDE